MEDEFESSARLLSPAEVKQADSKPATSSESVESKEENKAVQMQLLFAAEEQGDIKPAAESRPAESKGENRVSEMLLLPAAVEKQEDSKPTETKEKNTLSETRALPAAEEKQVESKPAESRLADSKAANSNAPQSKAFERPFRVKLRGSVLVLVRLPNKRSVRAAIHQLSTSGGVIHFEKPLDEKLEVELIFHLQKATIRGKAQMLFPMWATQGWMQPFRFVNLAESSRQVLDEKLKSFLGEAKGAAAGA